MRLTPLACVVSIGGGILGLLSYGFLSISEKKRIDQLAASIAWSLFETSVDQLTTLQLTSVLARVRNLAGFDETEP